MSQPVFPDPIRSLHLKRRSFLLAGAGAAVGLAAAACGGNSSSPSGSSSVSPGKNALGLTLPAGAAAATSQYYVQPFDSSGATYKALDFYETVYSRAPLADQFTMPLVRLDRNYQTVPGAAKSWEQSSDKLSWTFHIIPGITWTDGKELTAADFVETLRYSAEPKHAWDFAWFWSGVIKNYAEAVAGKVPTSQIGVRQGSDKYSVVFETEAPVAYMPSACLYTTPLSAAALDKYGSGTYNINPATCVSCGPYVLKTFDPTSKVVLSPNTKYTGPYPTPIAALVGKIYAGGDMLSRFQTGEIDTFNPGGVDIKIAAKSSKLKDLHLYKNPNDFEIYYTFFDCAQAPFDQVKVRQAFAHAVDRDAIVNALFGDLALPAYGYLMPGYPFAVTDPLKPLTNYDPAKAKQLLAEAGFPDGKGFPQITYSWFQNAPSQNEAVTQALAQNWNTVLGVDIKLQELDRTTFYDRMNAKPMKLQMGHVGYGMDYFDASNMLSVYKKGGRHNWDNADYDALLAKGAAESDKAKRQVIYTQAQELLTGDAPAVFVHHLLYGYYYGSYMAGAALEKNTYGYDGIQWPGFVATQNATQNLYVDASVTKAVRQAQTNLF